MEKIVRFDVFCPVCEHREVKDIEGAEPCNECLSYGGRMYTMKPLHFHGKFPDWLETEETGDILK